QLAARYDSAYQDQWRTYLRHASVRGFGGIADAASKLQTLAGPQSPLLAVIALASQNTPADTQLMQPTHVVVPANVTDKLIGATNQDYMNALLQVQSVLGQVNAAPPNARDALVSQASGSVANAQQAALKLAQGFKVVGDGAVSTSVTGLLNAPLKNVEPFLRNYGAGQATGGGHGVQARHGCALDVLQRVPCLRPHQTGGRLRTDAGRIHSGVAAVPELFQSGGEGLRRALPAGRGGAAIHVQSPVHARSE